MTTTAPAPIVRPRLSSTLFAERDELERDIRNNDAKIARLAVSPRWNWLELRTARIVKRSFERSLILLGIEIDLALEREVQNMEWLMSLSQEEVRARIDLAWRTVYSR
ncbi:hypothetical protein J4E85_002720 [Alternaria conjuncta]|uniref:uncharacterized protein n=1 Tax=Alternaria conjuncta TaxID=181017 RepID=UPI00221FCED2|nr:uncharacterized protein J4E85_002720 [Alternaria conjuncta]KAI4934859.1 hypothetical protein J4E85_002720 [Alternaria conjuncta]